MNLGGFGESPLIETYAGDDVVDGSIYDDTIMTGAGNDEVHATVATTTSSGAGFDILDGGFGNDDVFGQAATRRFGANVVPTTSTAEGASIRSGAAMEAIFSKGTILSGAATATIRFSARTTTTSSSGAAATTN
jgi:hypothetical protein